MTKGLVCTICGVSLTVKEEKRHYRQHNAQRINERYQRLASRTRSEMPSPLSADATVPSTPLRSSAAAANSSAAAATALATRPHGAAAFAAAALSNTAESPTTTTTVSASATSSMYIGQQTDEQYSYYTEEGIDYTEDTMEEREEAEEEAQQFVDLENDEEIMAASLAGIVTSLVAHKANHATEPLQVQLMDRRLSFPFTTQEQKSIELQKIFNSNHITKKAQEELLKFVNGHIANFADDAEQHTFLSAYRCAQVVKRKIDPIKATEVDMCPQGCYLYAQSSAILTFPRCGSNRFRDSTNQPAASHHYLPLEEQLARFLICDDNRSKLMTLSQIRAHHQNEYHSVFDGSVFNQMKAQVQEDDLFIALYVDAFQPFDRSSHSMTLVMATLYNLPISERYKPENVFLIAIIPGPRKPDIFSFLFPVLQSLLTLESAGMNVAVGDEVVLTAKAHLLCVAGDIVEMTTLSCTSGHTAFFGCRTCPVEGESGVNPLTNKKGGVFFPSNTLPPVREVGHFKATPTNNGLKRVSPFTVLSSFHGAFFFPIDEMHMWGQGIGKQLWAIATDDSAKYGITNPLWLDTNSPKSLGDHMESLVKTTNVYALSGEFFNIATSAGYARAVDFIEFIIHILPTTFAEILQLQYADYHAQDSPTTASTSQHDLNHCCHALVHISNICNISLKQCITEDDLEIMQTRINHWRNFLTGSWFSNKVCTINQHYMMHLPDNIRAMGPMKGYSARVLERTIGLVKPRIKSRSMPRENSISVLKAIHAENVDKRDRSSQAAENSSNSADTRLASVSEFDGKCDLAAMLQHYFGDTFDMEDGTITIVESRYSRTSGQLITATRVRGHPDPHQLVVLMENGYVICHLEAIFQHMNLTFALVEVAQSISLETGGIGRYILAGNRMPTFEIVAFNQIIAYAVLIPSLIEEGKTFVSWRY